MRSRARAWAARSSSASRRPRWPGASCASEGIALPENKPIIRLLTRYVLDPAISQGGEHLTIDVDLARYRNRAAA